MTEALLASLPALLRASDKNGLVHVAEAFSAIVKSSSEYGTPEACRPIAGLLLRPTDSVDPSLTSDGLDEGALRELYAHTTAQPLLCALGMAAPEAAMMILAALPLGTINPLAPVPEPLLLRLLRARLFPLAEAVYRRHKKPTGEASPSQIAKSNAPVVDWTRSAFVGFDDDDDDFGAASGRVLSLNSGMSGGSSLDSEPVMACAVAFGDKTWLEAALDAGAHGLALALVEDAGCQPLHRTSDGSTFLELVLTDRSLQPTTQSAMIRAMIDHGRETVVPLTLLERTSDGKALFSHLLARQLSLREDEDSEDDQKGESNLLCYALKVAEITGMERTDDGTTVFEALLSCVPRSRVCQRACVQLVESGNIDPHTLLSTGKQVFVQCASTPAAAPVVSALARCKSFQPLARSEDGKTMLEVALNANCRDAAMAILASGSVGRDVLLSDGHTAFEHAVSIAGTHEVVLASLAGQGISALTLLPPHNKTALEVALSHRQAAVAAILLTLSPDLLAFVRPGDTLETVIELVMRYSDPLAAQLLSANDSLSASTKLPSGRTLLEAAASSSATSSCKVLTDRISAQQSSDKL